MPVATVRATTSRQSVGKAASELGMARGTYRVVGSPKYIGSGKWRVELRRK